MRASRRGREEVSVFDSVFYGVSGVSAVSDSVSISISISGRLTPRLDSMEGDGLHGRDGWWRSLERCRRRG